MNIKRGLKFNTNTIPVKFHGPGHLSSILEVNSIIFDILSTTYNRILADLENVSIIETQLYCHSQAEFRGNARRCGKRYGSPPVSWLLDVIIFGPVHFMKDVGEHLSNEKMYLQDPTGCERCVPYRNPHAVTWGSDEMEELRSGPDLLAQLMQDQTPLEETEAPRIVRAALFK